MAEVLGLWAKYTAFIISRISPGSQGPGLILPIKMVNYLQQKRETKNRAKTLFSGIFWGSWEPVDQQAGGRLRGNSRERRHPG